MQSRHHLERIEGKAEPERIEPGLADIIHDVSTCVLGARVWMFISRGVFERAE